MCGMQEKLPGEVGDVGFKQSMQLKWLALDKSGGEPRIVRKVRPPWREGGREGGRR